MLSQTSARAPLATLLVGLITGLFLARQFDPSSNLLLTLALCGSLIALFLAHKRSFHLLWLAAFSVSSTICFWTYGSLRLAPKPATSDLTLPLREAQLTLKVQTVLRSSGRYQSVPVIACVLSAPTIGRLRDGDRVYARLTIPETFFPEQPPHALLQRGLQVRKTGLLLPIPEPLGTAPGNGFDRYLKSIGVHYRFDRTREPELVKPPGAFTRLCAATNQRFQTILQRAAPEDSEIANIYVTMLLGNDAVLSSEQRERYQRTGTLHFFAISGLHIGVIATVIAQCLILVRIPRSWGPWIGLPLLYFYVEITGAAPSAMRAFLMTAFFWASFAFQRQHASFTALINSAVFVLLIDPNQLWNLGFQLSYTVVASILLFGLPMGQHLKKLFQPYRWLPEEDWTPRQRTFSRLLENVFQLFAISFSAWLASMPLCAAFFGFIVPGAIILNILLVYLVAVVIICGILSIVCAVFFLPALSEFINHAAWLVISVMDGIVYLGMYLPTITFHKEASLRVLCYAVLTAYFLSLCWLHGNPKKRMTAQFWLPAVVLLFGMSLIVWV